MIEIKYGQSHSDATYDYIITISQPMTLREFIDEWIQDNGEWGYFYLWDGRSRLDYDKCEYRYGEIISEPFSDDILNKEIKSVSGSGGWSRSDFCFVLQ